MKPGSEIKWPTFQDILNYFQKMMAVVYILMGLVIFWKSEKLDLPASYAIPLSTILIAYGIIRGYRAFRRKTQE